MDSMIPQTPEENPAVQITAKHRAGESICNRFQYLLADMVNKSRSEFISNKIQTPSLL